MTEPTSLNEAAQTTEQARDAMPRARPLVFISHDSRDADLAEAFDNLLTDASGGMLKSFRSSDRRGASGIEFGAEWYRAIMEKLDSATDVVALLTRHSIDRPWILYEAGVAKGKLNTIVFGVAVGVPLERASTGPFAQFQNCGDDEDSLAKLVLELIRRNLPEATPREAAITREVTAFRVTVEQLLKGRAGPQPAETTPVDETAVAKLFEEFKVMVRDLPEAIGDRMRPGRRRRFHPMMIEELLHHPGLRDTPNGPALGWLAAMTLLRDDLPWAYELGMDVYRALQTNNEAAVARAADNFRRAAEALARGPWAEMMMDDRDASMMARHLPEMLDHYLHGLVSPEQRTRRRPTRVAPPTTGS